MNRDEALDILKKNNPFVSSSAGDPWKSKYPHVESVNRKTFQSLKRLIDQKRQDRSLNAAGLVLGEAGSGKTHLIGRVLELARQERGSVAFAYVQPIEDPEQTFRYLLREVVVNLCHPVKKSSGTAPLDDLLAYPMLECLERCFGGSREKKHEKLMAGIRSNPSRIFATRRLKPEARLQVAQSACLLLERSLPELPDGFLIALLRYRFGPKKRAALQWLKGGAIDRDDCRALGAKPRNDRSAAFLEQEARSILNAFGLLLARYGVVLVVCFDRLENLESAEQIRSFGKMVEFLVDTAPAMLPLVCCRGDLWDSGLKARLNEHVTTRLATNPFVLEGCSPSLAMEIIEKRLAFVLGGNRHDPCFPLCEDKLRKAFEGEIQSPREIIVQANRILNEELGAERVEVPGIANQLAEAFKLQYKNVLSDFKRHPPDRTRLRLAIELLLSHTGDTAGFCADNFRKIDECVDFMCRIQSKHSNHVPQNNGASKDAVFIVDVEEDFRTVGRCLQRGLDFLEKYTDGKAFYIRDARCPFPALPRWPATNRKREKFENSGGTTVFLQKEQAARLYALAFLKYAVKEGDVSVIDYNQNTRPATMEELQEFVRAWVHGGEDSFFEEFDRIVENRGETSLIP